MTLSVPYSFVPGAKAKANEVNANFVAVLDEIEKSNVKISELETQKADKNLSNLDNEGLGILDAKADKTEVEKKADKTELTTKADKTEIDGKWVNKSEFVIREATLSSTYDKTFTLSSILPNDGNIYEAIVSAIVRTGTQVNSCFSLCINSSICGSIYICRTVTRVANVNSLASGNCIIPISKDRKLRIFVGEETNVASYANSCSVKVSAYRKVR